MPEPWIITAGTFTDVDLGALGINTNPKRVMAYALSDIGRYLLCPGTIEVESRLMGCECLFKPKGWRRIKSAAVRLARLRPAAEPMADPMDRQLLLAHYFVRIPALKDRHLARHIDRIRGQLHSLDPVVKEIAAIAAHRLAEIRGVCEDEGGHRTYINLSGNLETKRAYIIENLLKEVPITLPQARIADGLYDMRGLKTAGYRPERQHRLLKFHVEGRFFACLINQDDKVEMWIDDINTLHQLVLLQQALETNPVLNTSLADCILGNARALRLMINHEMDIDYSRNRLPRVYHELFTSLKLDAAQQQGVIRSLNTHQMGVSFSFVPREGFGDPRAETSISILHDVKALEAFRQNAPELYAAISRKATLSEAGKYYLLESIKGRPDEEGL